MAYRDNVNSLAAKLGISNDPGLREEDIRIAELQFRQKNGDLDCIVRTDMNRGGRLFFQGLGGNGEEIIIDDALLTEAADFFAELWEPNPVPGKRKLLDAIRSSVSVTLIYKIVIEIDAGVYEQALQQGLLRVERYNLLLDLDFFEVVRVSGTSREIVEKESEPDD